MLQTALDAYSRDWIRFKDERPDAYPVATLSLNGFTLRRRKRGTDVGPSSSLHLGKHTYDPIANIFLYTALVWDIRTWRHGIHDIETSEVSKESR